MVRDKGLNAKVFFLDEPDPETYDQGAAEVYISARLGKHIQVFLV